MTSSNKHESDQRSLLALINCQPWTRRETWRVSGGGIEPYPVELEAGAKENPLSEAGFGAVKPEKAANGEGLSSLTVVVAAGFTLGAPADSEI